MGRAVLSAWAFSPEKIWAVGERGLILEWDGSAWGLVPGPYEEDVRAAKLTAVWGSSEADVWILAEIGEQGIAAALHWDGARWKRFSLPFELDAVALWGSRPTSVWIGARAGVAHWDGTAWRPSDAVQGIESLWGWNDRVVAVGDGGLFTWDGRRWTHQCQPKSELDQWMIASGRGRCVMDQDVGCYPVVGVWGPDAGDVWLSTSGLVHWDGRKFIWVPGVPALSSMRGTGSCDASGIASESLWHWDGHAWLEHRDAASVKPVALEQSRAGVWLLGGGIGLWDGQRTQVLEPPVPSRLDAVRVNPDGTAWAAGEGPSAIQRWDGRRWRGDTSLAIGGDGGGVIALASFGQNDIWALVDATAPEEGLRLIQRFDGGIWSIQDDVPKSIDDLWGIRSDDVWAVGGQPALPPDDSEHPQFSPPFGAIWHWDGTRWAQVQKLGQPLRKVSGASAKDAWAVGVEGLTLHWDGRAWATVPSGTRATLQGVAVAENGHAWAVGVERTGEVSSGVVLEWDGSRWARTLARPVPQLNAVWARSPSDVWAVGDAGTVLHWDGKAWTELASGTRESLEAIHGQPGALWIVGDHGTALQVVRSAEGP